MIWVETVDANGRHMVPVEEKPVVEEKKETPVEDKVVSEAPPEFEEVVKKTRTRKSKA